MEAGILFSIGIGAMVLIYILICVNDKQQLKNDAFVSSLINSDQGDLASRTYFLQQISDKITSQQISDRAYAKSLQFLEYHLADAQMQAAFFNYVSTNFVLPESRQYCYSSVFEVLSKYPDELPSSVKLFFLNVARWYYSGLRPNGVLTIYDEQAIQNDMSTLK